MANRAVPMRPNQLQLCCMDYKCINNFIDLPKRLQSQANWENLFDYYHHDSRGQQVVSMPKNSEPWYEFMEDIYQMKAEQLFELGYTTKAEVNAKGKDHVYAVWRTMLRYKGREIPWQGHVITRNMVDIVLFIPKFNLTKKEHFTFRYLPRRGGDAFSLTENLIKEAVGKIEDQYFNQANRLAGFRLLKGLCYTCNHNAHCPVPVNVQAFIPDWYLTMIYDRDEDGNLKDKVSIMFNLS